MAVGSRALDRNSSLTSASAEPPSLALASVGGVVRKMWQESRGVYLVYVIILWCWLNDRNRAPTDNVNQIHVSYAGNRGQYYGDSFYDQTDPFFPISKNSMTGVIFDGGRVRIADVTDGTSNTIIFGEQARGILTTADLAYLGWWQTGWWSDTLFDTSYLINAHRKFSGEIANLGWWWVPLQAASSFHPGGANFAMVDGSLQFLKDTIATWPLDNGNFGDPVGIDYGGTCGEYKIGTAKPLT